MHDLVRLIVAGGEARIARETAFQSLGHRLAAGPFGRTIARLSGDVMPPGDEAHPLPSAS